jgi:hypothetical protein
MKRKGGFNPKRRLKSSVLSPEEKKSLERNIRYGGNPEHKKNPGDFGLSPPSIPRQGKTLCDNAEVFSRNEALRILQVGVKKGLVSEQIRNGWPQNLWSVAPNGTPIEAQLENEHNGTYHGYPLQDRDPFAEIIMQAWEDSNEE